MFSKLQTSPHQSFVVFTRLLLRNYFDQKYFIFKLKYMREFQAAPWRSHHFHYKIQPCYMVQY